MRERESENIMRRSRSLAETTILRSLKQSFPSFSADFHRFSPIFTDFHLTDSCWLSQNTHTHSRKAPICHDEPWKKKPIDIQNSKTLHERTYVFGLPVSKFQITRDEDKESIFFSRIEPRASHQAN